MQRARRGTNRTNSPGSRSFKPRVNGIPAARLHRLQIGLPRAFAARREVEQFVRAKCRDSLRFREKVFRGLHASPCYTVVPVVDERSLHAAATRASRAVTPRSPLVADQLSASIPFLRFPWRTREHTRRVAIHCAASCGRP